MNRKSALKARETGINEAGENGFQLICILCLGRTEFFFRIDYLCSALKPVTINILFRCDVILAK